MDYLKFSDGRSGVKSFLPIKHPSFKAFNLDDYLPEHGVYDQNNKRVPDTEIAKYVLAVLDEDISYGTNYRGIYRFSDFTNKYKRDWLNLVKIQLFQRIPSDILQSIEDTWIPRGNAKIPVLDEKIVKDLFSAGEVAEIGYLRFPLSYFELDDNTQMLDKVLPIAASLGCQVEYLRERFVIYHSLHNSFDYPHWTTTRKNKIYHEGGRDYSVGSGQGQLLYDQNDPWYIGRAWCMTLSCQGTTPFEMIVFMTPDQLKWSQQHTCSNANLKKVKPWADLMYVASSHCERNMTQKLRISGVDFHNLFVTRKSLELWLATSFAQYSLTRTGVSLPGIQMYTGDMFASRSSLIESLKKSAYGG